MPTIDTTYSCEGIGNFRLSEVTGKDEQGYYTADTLVDLDGAVDLVLAVSIDNDVPDGFVEVALSGYHVKNPDTDRIFHGRLEIILERQDVRHLRNFLTYLLKTA